LNGWLREQKYLMRRSILMMLWTGNNGKGFVCINSM
jgi:hypothetical protein